MRCKMMHRLTISAVWLAIFVLSGAAVGAERLPSATAPEKERLPEASRRLPEAFVIEREARERFTTPNTARMASIDSAPGKWRELLQPVPGEKVNRRDTTAIRAELRKFRNQAPGAKWEDRSQGTNYGKFLRSDSVDKVWRPPVRVEGPAAENR